MSQHHIAVTKIVLLLALITRIDAHGLTSWPRQRGLLARNNFDLKELKSDANPDYCPHCLNGGGTGTVSKNTPDGLWTPYEPTDPAFRFRDDHGICGDPKGVNDHMAPDGQYYDGMTIATYEEEDYIDMETQINAHHNGYFEFFACDLDACGQPDISRKCFENGFCKKLLRVPHQSCESGHDRICGPVDPKYPGRWYLPPRDQDNPTDNWYGGLNKKMRYALPKGMSCEKCAIHWSWTTANSCNPPGYADYSFPEKWDGIPGDGGSLGSINRQFGTCGESTSSFPEEFWACSENVRIVQRDEGKSRTLQIFHNGDMNIEGPSDSSSTQLLKPTAEPVSALDAPQVTAEPPYNASNEETRAEHSREPVDSGSSLEQMDDSKTGSRYDLTAYITTFDTGVCIKGRDDMSFCEACINLGYGVTKCMWCHAGSDGKEDCTHTKPNE